MRMEGFALYKIQNLSGAEAVTGTGALGEIAGAFT